jgi:hypothetical protein
MINNEDKTEKVHESSETRADTMKKREFSGRVLEVDRTHTIFS